MHVKQCTSPERSLTWSHRPQVKFTVPTHLWQREMSPKLNALRWIITFQECVHFFVFFSDIDTTLYSLHSSDTILEVNYRETAGTRLCNDDLISVLLRQMFCEGGTSRCFLRPLTD